MSLFEERALSALAELEVLRRHAEVPLEDYLNQPDLRDIVERRLIRLLERCIDLGRMLANELGLAPAQTAREMFERLAGQGAIPKELLPTVREMVGMRNVLVHEYDRIDDTAVHEAVAHRLVDVLALVSALRDAHQGAGRGGPGDSR